MTDSWLALLGHLRHAADSYGGDLPVSGLKPGPLLRAPTQKTSDKNPGRSGPAHQERPWAQPKPQSQTTAKRRKASQEPTVSLRPASKRPTATGEPSEQMAALRAAVLPCTKCQLHKSATQVVFGEGNPAARVLFVGEAPGEVEDDTGRPFVGPSGTLLDKIIEKAMGLRREDVFIANVNKCRPPGNRDPEPLEIASCLPWLRDQIKIINPEVIVTLGRVAMWNLLGITDSMGRMRGKQLDYEGIPVVATWHPAYLLRKPAAKADTWADIKRVNALLGNPEVPSTKNPGRQ